MPTADYYQHFDNSPVMVRIHWHVDWWALSFREFGRKSYGVVIGEKEMLGMEMQSKDGWWHKIDLLPSSAPSASFKEVEQHFKDLLDKDDVRQVCEEKFQSNPKLYTEAA